MCKVVWGGGLEGGSEMHHPIFSARPIYSRIGKDRIVTRDDTSDSSDISDTRDHGVYPAGVESVPGAAVLRRGLSRLPWSSALHCTALHCTALH